MALRGTFDETDPEDVLQILAIGGRTGTLTVRDQGRDTRIVFRNGRVIDAFDGLQRGEDAVFSVLVSRAGSFRFEPGDVPPEQTIQTTVPAMLLGVSQRIDDLRRAKDILGGPTSRPYRQRPDEPAPELAPDATELVELVDGKRSLGEIVAAVDQSVEQVYAHLLTFVDEGLIGIAMAEDRTRPLLAEGDLSDVQAPPIAKVEPTHNLAPTASDLRETAEFLKRAVAG